MGNASSEHRTATCKVTERGYSKELKLQYAVSGMRGLRNTMEDRHLHACGIPVKDAATAAIKHMLADHALFAVFDGHGGVFTSSYLEGHFLSVLSKRKELFEYANLPKTGSRCQSDVNGVLLLKEALVNTFLQLDEMLLPLQEEINKSASPGASNRNASGSSFAPADPSESKCDGETTDSNGSSMTGRKSETVFHPPTSAQQERSGSTAVAVLMTPSHILCANLGDSRAILRRYGRVLPLSFDHKPSNVPERMRIQASGGVVRGKRVDGDLAVSRAFGDFVYKTNASASCEKQKVIAVPDIVVYPRDMEGDEFILLACDGVWDVASRNQCSEFVQLLLAEGESDLGNICEEILDTCLERNSRDNMTVMIVGLPAVKADRSNTAALHNTLWGHRTARKVREISETTRDATTFTCTRVSRVD